MPTGKKSCSCPDCTALNKRVEKLTAELKTARNNLRGALQKAARDAKAWQAKLVIQAKRYDEKMKTAQQAAIMKHKLVWEKKIEAKKKAIASAIAAAEAKFEKVFAKKMQPVHKKALTKKATPKKPAAKKVVKKATTKRGK